MQEKLKKHAATIDVNQERCKGCGLCVATCPKELLQIVPRQVNSHGYPFVGFEDNGQCIGCASCGIICPDGCITVYKEGGKRTQETSDSDASCCTSNAASEIGNTALEAENASDKDEEVRLMKGNEALAHAAIRTGVDGYFGYPITPQSEILETLAAERPWETTGMVVLQAESETASVNMLYGGGAAGKKVFTSSSSIGIALMQEGVSYCAGAELPVVLVNVQRGGPGLGTIQPSQGDYFQATRGGGNGDYNTIVLAPASVQEMADFVDDAFTLAFRYRNPAMILSDGIIGQMMEPVRLPKQRRRRTDEEVRCECPWATTGRTPDRKPNIITSLELRPEQMEANNLRLQRKYKEIKEKETRWETIMTEDAEHLIVAFGSAARIAESAIKEMRENGVKVGLFRPITVWPYPEKALREAAKGVKDVLVVEINAGQMVQDVRLALNGCVPVHHYGRLGGMVPEPKEIVDAMTGIINNGKEATV